MLKPSVSSQLMSQTGMGRPGGTASRGSSPAVKSKGSGFAAMENALLKSGVKTPAQAKRVTGGGPGRQFGTVAAGGNVSGSKPFSDTSIKANPSILAVLSANQYGGKLGK